MSLINEFGVPMEPQDKVMAADWKGDDLYENDVVYITEDGLVREEDMPEYIGMIYLAPMSVFEYMESEKND